MMGIKDWVLSQLVSKSLASSRPLSGNDSFFHEEPLEEAFGTRGSERTTNLVALPVAVDASQFSSSNPENQNQAPLQQVSVDNSCQSHCNTDKEKKSSLAKIEDLQIKFLRVLSRIGRSQDDLLVAKVLYRMHLATLIRAAGDSDLRKANVKIDQLRAIAAERESSGLPELDFSFRILVLGKTGVGKSSTINSIFDQSKVRTDAFRPSTNSIEEVVGTVNGIKMTIIDTPGLLPTSACNVRKNRKILCSVKRFIRKSPPDIVLYFERLDLINMQYSDFPLLKLITNTFGSAIWFNTILVMTHSSSALPEGSHGYPVSYDSYVNKCTNLVQQYIHQTVSDLRLENPVLLVENHPRSRTDLSGEEVLANGQAWKSRLLLLCTCTKILGDVNTLLDFRDTIELGPLGSTRLPSLPHLLSSFLKPRNVPNGSENEIDEIPFSDSEDNDEYDQLPPIRILTKSQFKKLTKSQKEDYLDELEFRETLYLKKQLKEEYRNKRDKKNLENASFAGDNNSESQDEPTEPVLLPDITLPPNFDSDYPASRYRCVVMNDTWLARPVLDPHGWDHDVGFDGINLETAMEIRKDVFVSVNGQMSKDKQDFSIQSECAAAFVNNKGTTYTVGCDIQSAGKDLICTVHGNTKLRFLKHNVTECGVSVISMKNGYYVGAKLEDSVLVGKRLKFAINAGSMGGLGQVASGGSLEATLRGRDFPVRNDKVSLAMTVLSFNNETVLGGSFQSDFRLCRGARMSINANLNNRKMGQICVKASSSEHMQIALVAALSLLRALLWKKGTNDFDRDVLETG